VRVVGNAILNGPSPNRDLGNLWPCVDNDDGSQFYWVKGNLCVYGGFKNYLGQNKKWDSNLVVFPDRWAGDTCLTQWGGQEHVYSNNTCITSSDNPQFYTASVLGDLCLFDYTNATVAPFLTSTHGNTYHTRTGAFSQGCDVPFNLTMLQAVGQEVGSVAVAGYAAGDVVAQAQALLDEFKA
jgi:hypothetical protein